MRLCAAQTQSIRGDIQRNIERHKTLIDLAAANAADTVIFPELSLTAYEPALAYDLATDIDDRRFDVFQTLADSRQLTIGVGAPIRSNPGICIGMVLFQPRAARQLYSKTYIHADEEPFFVSGKNSKESIGPDSEIALAICYELSVPEHAENASRNGAQFYFASAAKTPRQVDGALERLSQVARQYSMTVLLSNCMGPCDGAQGGGRSSIWNHQGQLLGQLDDTHEGILMIDTETQNVVKQTI